MRRDWTTGQEPARVRLAAALVDVALVVVLVTALVYGVLRWTGRVN